MLEALLLLQKRAPIHFTVCAFTIEQGKFLSADQPVGEYLELAASLDLSWKMVLRPARGPTRSRLRHLQPLPPPRRV